MSKNAKNSKICAAMKAAGAFVLCAVDKTTLHQSNSVRYTASVGTPYKNFRVRYTRERTHAKQIRNVVPGETTCPAPWLLPYSH